MRKTYFGKMLEEGKVGEDLAMSYMQRLGYEVTDVSGNRNYFYKDIDFLAKKGDIRMAIEVKTESRTAKTGNVCIEDITNKALNKPGWIHYTESTHLFFVEKQTRIIHCVRTDELRQLFHDEKANLKRLELDTLEGGKYFKTGVIYLMPLDKLRKLPHYQKLTPTKVSKIEGGKTK